MTDIYDDARRKGIIDRAIKTPFDPRTTDRKAKDVERWLLRQYGMEGQVTNKQDTCDFRYRFRTQKGPQVAHGDIKWTPRLDGRLIVPKDSYEKHVCLVYVLVVGDPDAGTLECPGWAWGHRLADRLDMSLPEPGYSIPRSDPDFRANVDLLMAATFHAPRLT
jgi:hypothetical protein